MARQRTKWSKAEDELLEQAILDQESQKKIDWNYISSFIPRRNNKDCRKRWYYKTGNRVNKGPWQKQEDRRLISTVAKYGKRWAMVARIVGTRNGDQCAKRWRDALDPEIDHSPWTAAEDEMLQNATRVHGRSWRLIVDMYFPKRTSLAAKNRFTVLNRLPKDSSRSRTKDIQSADEWVESTPLATGSELDSINQALDSFDDYSNTNTVISTALNELLDQQLTIVEQDSQVDEAGHPASKVSRTSSISSIISTMVPDFPGDGDNQVRDSLGGLGLSGTFMVDPTGVGFDEITGTPQESHAQQVPIHENPGLLPWEAFDNHITSSCSSPLANEFAQPVASSLPSPIGSTLSTPTHPSPQYVYTSSVEDNLGLQAQVDEQFHSSASGNGSPWHATPSHEHQLFTPHYNACMGINQALFHNQALETRDQAFCPIQIPAPSSANSSQTVSVMMPGNRSLTITVRLESRTNDHFSSPNSAWPQRISADGQPHP